MKNVNYMRDLMLTGFELSRISGVPMLYLGNPGVGKTTIVRLWAKRHGYHVESLIGSAFDRSEILGYMVNDGAGTDHLRTKEPEWFHTILEKEKEGIPSVLFIDEISGAPKDVQASLYRLIFERSIGNDKKLPESTIIASASNYKDNLPSICDITSPNLNRFCIVNFGPQTFEGLYHEFLQEPEDLEANLPKFEELPLTEELQKKSLELVTEIFDEINKAYITKDCSKGVLNVKNKNFSGVFSADYSKDGEVYNFISGRTIGYFKDIFRAMYVIGLTKPDYIAKFIDGLIGLGFNSFSDIQELNFYRRFLREITKKALYKMRGKEEDVVEFMVDPSATIAEKVRALSAQVDQLEIAKMEEACAAIFFDITGKFAVDTVTLSKLKKNPGDNATLMQLRDDFSAVEIFKLIVSDFPASKTKDTMLNRLDKIIEKYADFINSCIQTSEKV